MEWISKCLNLRLSVKRLLSLIGVLLVWSSSAFAALPFDRNFASYWQLRVSLNQLSNQELILSYHRMNPSEGFAILDKKSQLLSIYSADGILMEQSKVQAPERDELTQGAAGIYQATQVVKQGLTQDLGSHQLLKAESNAKYYKVFEGNILLPEGLKVYVLPTNEDQHRFMIRDSRITFTSSKVKRIRPQMNYSRFSPHPSKIFFENYQGSEYVAEFISTVAREKNTLMGLMKLEDDEYNLLAQLAFGIMVPETNNGKSWKYHLKEKAPWLVALLKGNGLNADQNSRGPTQIKKIPQAVVDHYGFTKDELHNPRVAAITTVAFCAELLRDLRAIAHLHPEIHEDNLHFYLYYLYQGRRQAIRDGSATPDRNINVRKIFQQIERFPLYRQL